MFSSTWFDPANLWSEALPSEALCLAGVHGLAINEALTRFDASQSTRTTTLVVADERDGWVFLAEHNGFHGSLPEVLAGLSNGTVAAAVYWNVDSLLTR
ncbi:hypothetical protein [Lentzea albidocapillata]|uniref:Uncharacterized protein n=1 Tax=Lentzea albidocapillata TaxID=40571 RepID=A0A1W2FTD5_9PSEU|nr:hypothetical protein [Lentzea albidocapillata]SMD25229.1 hypothetical protein SAMN05660733_08066 [Lentzea albidocapillata]